jgi:hypothetical protein
LNFTFCFYGNLNLNDPGDLNFYSFTPAWRAARGKKHSQDDQACKGQ